MTVCEMQAAQDKARKEHQLARKDFEKTLAALRKAKAPVSKEVLAVDPSEPWDVGLGRLYCNAIAALKPRIARAQSPPRASGKPIQAQVPLAQLPKSQIPQIVQQPNVRPSAPEITTQLAIIETQRARLDESTQQMNAYGVEIHKKFALAVACFVFVLLGAPIALRFPRGGVGLTIGVSLFVFALYYVCLIVGESLGKRGLMPAVVSMWMANVIFALIALLLLAKMGKEGSTARGGDMREMFDSIRGWVRSKVGRKKVMTQPERAAA
jgi:hypothetical protein